MVLEVDTTDIVVVALVLLGTLLYLSYGRLWGVDKSKTTGVLVNANGPRQPSRTRNIIEKMEQSGKKMVVFFGSQTGTAEDYANRLAKEGHSRFGLAAMTADLEDYDLENLDTFPADHLAMFVMATYGEGEPTDNAAEFMELIAGEEPNFSNGGGKEDAPLSSMRYIAFGLGNTTYELYNEMVRKVDRALTDLGAHRIGPRGEGDDGAGTMEEDFLAWKEDMWKSVQETMGVKEREAVYEPSIEVSLESALVAEDESVYVGEPNKQHLKGAKGPYNAHNPFIAPISSSRELFTVKDRNCIHVEIDLKGSGLTYTTGDHLAVWPTNANREVDRFLRVLGLDKVRDSVISVKALDVTAKIPFPTPTTYDAVARYYMEICAPVSRQFVGQLAPYAPSQKIVQQLARLGADKDAFSQEISSRYLNIAQMLEIFGEGAVWDKIPFSLMLEGLNHMVPRYYSISSSSLESKTNASITAVVESIRVPGGKHILKGVTTNYILALKQRQHGESSPEPHGLMYNINGPRNRYDGIHIPVHVRHSNYKMPSDPSKPMILTGPGTGVAPLRGFVRERILQKQKGLNVGKTLLFFGCRRANEDFLYREEWEHAQEVLGDAFELITAFSRDGPQKVYVQHRMEERSIEVNHILQEGGYFYVCGDASNMARAVNDTLCKIISKERGISGTKAADLVKSMRASNLYQEDCW